MGSSRALAGLLLVVATCSSNGADPTPAPGHGRAAGGLPDHRRADPELQRRIRSATACYLDLGDAAVPTSGEGRLVHMLSDQQCDRTACFTPTPPDRRP